VVDYNLWAIRAYQKCGFVVEGREREAAFVDGIWHDDVMMAILDREYAEIERGKARVPGHGLSRGLH
jgi:RimJ/RimL family protein N-acetyltransferase